MTLEVEEVEGEGEAALALSTFAPDLNHEFEASGEQ